ncbi:MAG: response regulator [Acidobacteria bacterium]|nr:response regulator [Acidobacteriota bacterium]
MKQTLSLLLVEDNPADVDMIRDLLSEPGPTHFELEVIDRLAGAIERTQRGDINLVLLDLGLPDSNGLETFVSFHRAAPEVATIVLTGNNDQDVAVAAVAAGAQDFFVKGEVRGNLLVRAARYAVERKQAEESRKKLQAQLLQAQKMESVGRLAGGIAHDFNNLLTVINGTAALASMGLAGDDPLRLDLQEIGRAGERAAALTRQLLAFSHMQVMQPIVMNLGAAVADLRRMLQRLIGEDVDLILKPGPGMGCVRADPGQIEQVIMNLVVNARAAMPTGGSLTIETRSVDLDEAFAANHPPIQPGPHVLLAVSDTGVGMDEATRDRIFEPFFTTKPLGQGTGLGLATVRGIVTQSRGSIWVDTELGRGTRFEIYLPRIDEAPSVVRPARTRVVAGGTETILIVEDDLALRHLATRMIQAAGYTVLTASNGEEALLRMERHREPVHLMLTDMVMPGIHGSELATRLAETRPEIKVLYMSGYTDDAVARHGALGSAIHFIAKPFTAGNLTLKMREMLDG